MFWRDLLVIKALTWFFTTYRGVYNFAGPPAPPPQPQTQRAYGAYEPKRALAYESSTLKLQYKDISL